MKTLCFQGLARADLEDLVVDLGRVVETLTEALNRGESMFAPAYNRLTAKIAQRRNGPEVRKLDPSHQDVMQAAVTALSDLDAEFVALLRLAHLADGGAA